MALVKKHWRDVALMGLLALLWGLFFWRFLTPNPIDQLRFAVGDFTLHYFAFASYHVEQIQAGNWFPLWNPYNYAGDPFMGNVQWATWYPLRFLTAFLSRGQALSIELYQFEMLLHYLIAGWLMFIFLRQLVGRRDSAFLGALLYTYGGYLAGYPMLQPSVLAAVTWTPLLMLGVHLSCTRRGWDVAGVLLGSVAIALSFLGGHPQTTMQMIYFAGAYLVFLGWQGKMPLSGIAWRGVILVGLGVGLAMVQLLPAVEFTALSARVQDLFYDAKSNGFGAGEFFHVLYPFIISSWSPLYIGVVGLLMVVGALLNYRPAYHFWVIVIIVGLLLSMGGKNVVYDVFYLVVPGFSTFRQQERIASIVVFSLVVLATYRLDLLLSKALLDSTKERFVRGLHAVGTSVLALGATLASPFIVAEFIDFPLREDVTFFDLMQEVMTLVAVISVLYWVWYVWQKSYAGKRWHVSLPIIALVVVDLFTFNTRYSINFVPNEAQYITQAPAFFDLLRRDVSDITWRVDGGASLQGHGTYWRIPDMYGTGPFELGTTERLLRIGVDKRWELFAVRYASQPLGSQPPEQVSLSVIGEGVNYFGGYYTLYELENPRPMAHLVYDVRYPEGDYEDLNDRRQAVRAIVNGAIHLRETGVVGEALPRDLSGERPEGASVDGFQMVTSEHVRMIVNTPERALLTVSIPHYPIWRASVDGEAVDIIEVYGGLIGILLETGEGQEVVLTTHSESYETGHLLSLLSLLALLTLGTVSYRLNMRRTATARGA